MKHFTVIIMLGSLLIAASCNSKKEETKKEDTVSVDSVPPTVKSNFAAKYPLATEVVWETANENGNPTFKAKFMINGKKWKAEFSEAGGFLKEKGDE